jgi:hypothetical protein
VTPDPAFKKSKLFEKIAGFAGYGGRHALETDWQLRKYLAAELEKVRDRLVQIMANRSQPDPLQEQFGYSLKTVAYLKAELAPAKGREVFTEDRPPENEDRLLNADLLLLEKVEALHTPLDTIETAASSPRSAEALNLFDEGLAEVDDLFRLRRRLFRGKTRP